MLSPRLPLPTLVALACLVAFAAADNLCGVKLVEQTSHGQCVYGTTFGCANANTMWVKNCSGTFTCGAVQDILRCASVHFARANCSCAPPAPTPPPGPIIGGQGRWRYQYMPDLLQLPAGAEMQHAHGLEVDKSGNIYLT